VSWDSEPEVPAPASSATVVVLGAAPPAPAARPPVPASFRRAWARWTAVVEALARRPDWPPCGEQGYRGLYRGLLEGCAAHADRPGEEGAFFRELETLVRPWLSLAVLARTEPALLEDLAVRARRAGDKLGVAAPARGWALLAAAALLVLAAGWAAGPFLPRLLGGWAGAARPLLRGWRVSLEAGPGWWAAPLAALALLLAIGLLPRRRP
jgi:hypothetical protein